MTAPRPYQVCLYVGASVPELPDVRVVDLTPAEPTADAVLTRLRDSALNPADMRARVLVVIDEDPAYRDHALLVYAALLGFAKRRLDVAFGMGGEALVLSDFDAMLRKRPDAGRPDSLIAQAQVGGPSRDDLPYIDISTGFTAEAISTIRFARRLRFVPPAVAAHALPQLVAVAAFRARGETDKLPYLCTGDEAAPTEDTAQDVVGICLDTLRREAEELRRSLRSDNRDALAEKVELPARYQRLVDADALPVADVLLRLGARSMILDVDPKPDSPEYGTGEKVQVEVWHCPRPDRHTNGDATPSARINAKSGGFQCFRCHRERINALRLVMDVLECSADESADWLLAAH